MLRMNLFSWRILRMKNLGQKRILRFLGMMWFFSQNGHGSYGRNVYRVPITVKSSLGIISSGPHCCSKTHIYGGRKWGSERLRPTPMVPRSVRNGVGNSGSALDSSLHSWRYQMVFISDPSWEPSLPLDPKAITLVRWQDMTHVDLWCSRPGHPLRAILRWAHQD